MKILAEQQQMLDFNKVISIILKNEGGFVDNPKDPGGRTNFGITQSTAKSWGYAKDVKLMTSDEAKALYKKNIYDKYAEFSSFPDELTAINYFDAIVNHGYGNAAKILQRALGVTVDGKIGPATLSALKSKDSKDLILSFVANRILFYTSLSTFSTFGKGWMNRVAANLVIK